MAALDSVIANNTEALAAELLAAPAEIFYAMHVDCLHHPSVVEALDIDSLVESVSLLGLAGLMEHTDCFKVIFSAAQHVCLDLWSLPLVTTTGLITLDYVVNEFPEFCGIWIGHPDDDYSSMGPDAGAWIMRRWIIDRLGRPRTPMEDLLEQSPCLRMRDRCVCVCAHVHCTTLPVLLYGFPQLEHAPRAHHTNVSSWAPGMPLLYSFLAPRASHKAQTLPRTCITLTL